MAWSFVAAACSSSVPKKLSSKAARSAWDAASASVLASATAEAVPIATRDATSRSSLSFRTSALAARPRWIAWSFVAAAISDPVPSKSAYITSGERSGKWRGHARVATRVMRTVVALFCRTERRISELGSRTSSSPIASRRTAPSDQTRARHPLPTGSEAWGGAARCARASAGETRGDDGLQGRNVWRRIRQIF